jgi:hypothetical protein
MQFRSPPNAILAACAALLLLPATAVGVEDAQSDALSGRNIYQRVLDNKLDTSYQEQRIISSDPGGSTQLLGFWSRFKDFRELGKAERGEVISKTVLKFTDPYDKRETGYLYVEKKGTTNDGYHYSRRREKVMRINTAKESVFGTDFSLDDISIVRHIDDATYQRHADEELQGVPVWVVEVFHKPESDPPYARSMIYVDQKLNVPLRTRHWNDAGFEEKELTAPRDKIQEFVGVWIPMESTMRNLAEDTHSDLYIDRVDPNVEFSGKYFDPKRLSRMN